MCRVFILFFIFFSSLGANSLAGKYELYAPTIQSKGDEVIASGGAVIYNQNYSFSAQKVIYNQKSQILELIGDVYVSYEDDLQTKNDYLKINLKGEKFDGKKLFLHDGVSDLWIKSDRTIWNKEKYRLYDASISSCDVKNPDWQFKFNRGTYYSEDQYVSLNHPRFYIKGVPVFYFPWFAFPTATARKSGLLKPYIGFENSENLLFVQPIFIAPYKNWDIELNPQIRLDRGIGLYSTLRFVDSKYSNGSVTMGVFREKNAYAASRNLEKSVHKGIEIKYQNSSPLSRYFKNSNKYKDGLLLDFTNLSDIDYINLKDESKLAVNQLVTSRLNYYLTDSNRYVGFYAKYFIDTGKLNNDDTLQTLPSIQYHQFTKNLLFKNFLYSFDYKFKNSYRKEGLRTRQHEISLPIIFNKRVFNDFLNFSISENLYYSRVNYFEGNATTKNANYFSNYHNLSISSDLTKKHKNYIHNMQFDLSYIIPSFQNKSGYFADFIPFNLEQKSIRLKFNEYFYDLDGFDFLIHRIRQNIFLENEDENFNDLENEIIYKFSKDFSIKNTLIYSHEHKKLKKIQSGLYYNDNYNNLRLDHTFVEAPEIDKINFLRADYSRKIDRQYSFFTGVDYDFDEDFTKEWRAGLRMKKKCWDYEIRYKESVTPSLTSTGTRSITRRGVYFFVRLANIGDVEIKSEKDFALDE